MYLQCFGDRCLIPWPQEKSPTTAEIPHPETWKYFIPSPRIPLILYTDLEATQEWLWTHLWWLRIWQKSWNFNLEVGLNWGLRSLEFISSKFSYSYVYDWKSSHHMLSAEPAQLRARGRTGNTLSLEFRELRSICLGKHSHKQPLSAAHQSWMWWPRTLHSDRLSVFLILNVEDPGGVLETSVLRPYSISNTLGLTNRGLHFWVSGSDCRPTPPICHSFQLKKP